MSVTTQFPASWRFTAEVERSGGTDPKGIPLPGSEHEVPDCLIDTQASEDVVRSDTDDTTAWLYAPTGADFASGDRVIVPESPLWIWGTFQVTGRPSVTPLGVRVPLREV